jgi:hypothetical protein
LCVIRPYEALHQLKLAQLQVIGSHHPTIHFIFHSFHSLIDNFIIDAMESFFNKIYHEHQTNTTSHKTQNSHNIQKNLLIGTTVKSKYDLSIGFLVSSKLSGHYSISNVSQCNANKDNVIE